MFLAPRRDFTPGGTPRGEGGEADIESPFASPAKPADAEWIPPAPKADDPSMGRPKGPVEESPVVTFMPLARVEPKTELELRTKPRPTPAAPTPVEEPTTPVPDKLPPPLSAATPALIKPRPVRPALLQPSKPPRPDSSAASADLIPHGRSREDGDVAISKDIDVSKDIDEALPDPAQDGEPPRLRVAFRFDMSSTSPLEAPLDGDMPPPRRRPVGSLRPASSDPAPDGPPPPARGARLVGAAAKASRSSLAGLAAAWAMYSRGCLSVQDHLLRLAGQALGLGRWRSLLAGLAAAWAMYLRGCLSVQDRLMRLAGRALGQGRRLASLAGTTLLRLGELGARWLGAVAARSWQGAKVAARTSWDFVGKIGDVGEMALLRTGGALISFRKTALRLLTSGLQAGGSVLAATTAAASQRVIAFRQRRKDAKKAMPPPDGGACNPTPTSSRPESLRTAAPPAAVAKPVAEPAATSPTADERPGFPAAFPPTRLALGGLAAASVAFLFLAFGPNQTPGSATAALTFPLPEKPEGPSEPPRRHVAAGTGPEAGTAVAADRAVLPDLTDPLGEMIAYVDALEPTAAADGKAFLAGAETVENVGRFLQAAEIVGLERLLEPGEDYTFLAPTDAAFARFESGGIDDLLKPAGHERLLILMSHHVLSERLTFDDLAGEVREYTSLAGRAVTIDATDAVRIGDAGVVDADLPTENGVLHVIDQVLPIDTP